jgi:hypothetical protein
VPPGTNESFVTTWSLIHPQGSTCDCFRALPVIVCNGVRKFLYWFIWKLAVWLHCLFCMQTGAWTPYITIKYFQPWPARCSFIAAELIWLFHLP